MKLLNEIFFSERIITPKIQIFSLFTKYIHLKSTQIQKKKTKIRIFIFVILIKIKWWSLLSTFFSTWINFFFFVKFIKNKKKPLLLFQQYLYRNYLLKYKQYISYIYSWLHIITCHRKRYVIMMMVKKMMMTERTYGIGWCCWKLSSQYVQFFLFIMDSSFI